MNGSSQLPLLWSPRKEYGIHDNGVDSLYARKIKVNRVKLYDYIKSLKNDRNNYLTALHHLRNSTEITLRQNAMLEEGIKNKEIYLRNIYEKIKNKASDLLDVKIKNKLAKRTLEAYQKILNSETGVTDSNAIYSRIDQLQKDIWDLENDHNVYKLKYQKEKEVLSSIKDYSILTRDLIDMNQQLVNEALKYLDLLWPKLKYMPIDTQKVFYQLHRELRRLLSAFSDPTEYFHNNNRLSEIDQNLDKASGMLNSLSNTLSKEIDIAPDIDSDTILLLGSESDGEPAEADAFKVHMPGSENKSFHRNSTSSNRNNLSSLKSNSRLFNALNSVNQILYNELNTEYVIERMQELVNNANRSEEEENELKKLSQICIGKIFLKEILDEKDFEQILHYSRTSGLEESISNFLSKELSPQEMKQFDTERPLRIAELFAIKNKTKEQIDELEQLMLATETLLQYDTLTEIQFNEVAKVMNYRTSVLKESNYGKYERMIRQARIKAMKGRIHSLKCKDNLTDHEALELKIYSTQCDGLISPRKGKHFSIECDEKLREELYTYHKIEFLKRKDKLTSEEKEELKLLQNALSLRDEFRKSLLEKFLAMKMYDEEELNELIELISLMIAKLSSRGITSSEYSELDRYIGIREKALVELDKRESARSLIENLIQKDELTEDECRKLEETCKMYIEYHSGILLYKEGELENQNHTEEDTNGTTSYQKEDETMIKKSKYNALRVYLNLLNSRVKKRLLENKKDPTPEDLKEIDRLNEIVNNLSASYNNARRESIDQEIEVLQSKLSLSEDETQRLRKLQLLKKSHDVDRLTMEIEAINNDIRGINQFDDNKMCSLFKTKYKLESQLIGMKIDLIIEDIKSLIRFSDSANKIKALKLEKCKLKLGLLKIHIGELDLNIKYSKDDSERADLKTERIQLKLDFEQRMLKFYQKYHGDSEGEIEKIQQNIEKLKKILSLKQESSFDEVKRKELEYLERIQELQENEFITEEEMKELQLLIEKLEMDQRINELSNKKLNEDERLELEKLLKEKKILEDELITVQTENIMKKKQREEKDIEDRIKELSNKELTKEEQEELNWLKLKQEAIKDDIERVILKKLDQYSNRKLNKYEKLEFELLKLEQRFIELKKKKEMKQSEIRELKCLENLFDTYVKKSRKIDKEVESLMINSRIHFLQNKVELSIKEQRELENLQKMVKFNQLSLKENLTCEEKAELENLRREKRIMELSNKEFLSFTQQEELEQLISLERIKILKMKGELTEKERLELDRLRREERIYLLSNNNELTEAEEDELDYLLKQKLQEKIDKEINDLKSLSELDSDQAEQLLKLRNLRDMIVSEKGTKLYSMYDSIKRDKRLNQLKKRPNLTKHEQRELLMLEAHNRIEELENKENLTNEERRELAQLLADRRVRTLLDKSDLTQDEEYELEILQIHNQISEIRKQKVLTSREKRKLEELRERLDFLSDERLKNEISILEGRTLTPERQSRLERLLNERKLKDIKRKIGELSSKSDLSMEEKEKLMELKREQIELQEDMLRELRLKESLSLVELNKLDKLEEDQKKLIESTINDLENKDNLTVDEKRQLHHLKSKKVLTEKQIELERLNRKGSLTEQEKVLVEQLNQEIRNELIQNDIETLMEKGDLTLEERQQLDKLRECKKQMNDKRINELEEKGELNDEEKELLDRLRRESQELNDIKIKQLKQKSKLTEEEKIYLDELLKKKAIYQERRIEELQKKGDLAEGEIKELSDLRFQKLTSEISKLQSKRSLNEEELELLSKMKDDLAESRTERIKYLSSRTTLTELEFKELFYLRRDDLAERIGKFESINNISAQELLELNVLISEQEDNYNKMIDSLKSKDKKNELEKKELHDLIKEFSKIRVNRLLSQENLSEDQRELLRSLEESIEREILDRILYLKSKKFMTEEDEQELVQLNREKTYIQLKKLTNKGDLTDKEKEDVIKLREELEKLNNDRKEILRNKRELTEEERKELLEIISDQVRMKEEEICILEGKSNLTEAEKLKLELMKQEANALKLESINTKTCLNEDELNNLESLKKQNREVVNYLINQLESKENLTEEEMAQLKRLKEEQQQINNELISDIRNKGDISESELEELEKAKHQEYIRYLQDKQDLNDAEKHELKKSLLQNELNNRLNDLKGRSDLSELEKVEAEYISMAQENLNLTIAKIQDEIDRIKIEIDEGDCDESKSRLYAKLNELFDSFWDQLDFELISIDYRMQRIVEFDFFSADDKKCREERDSLIQTQLYNLAKVTKNRDVYDDFTLDRLDTHYEILDLLKKDRGLSIKAQLNKLQLKILWEDYDDCLLKNKQLLYVVASQQIEYSENKDFIKDLNELLSNLKKEISTEMKGKAEVELEKLGKNSSNMMLRTKLNMEIELANFLLSDDMVNAQFQTLINNYLREDLEPGDQQFWKTILNNPYPTPSSKVPNPSKPSQIVKKELKGWKKGDRICLSDLQKSILRNDPTAIKGVRLIRKFMRMEDIEEKVRKEMEKKEECCEETYNPPTKDEFKRMIVRLCAAKRLHRVSTAQQVKDSMHILRSLLDEIDDLSSKKMLIEFDIRRRNRGRTLDTLYFTMKNTPPMREAGTTPDITIQYLDNLKQTLRINHREIQNKSFISENEVIKVKLQRDRKTKALSEVSKMDNGVNAEIQRMCDILDYIRPNEDGVIKITPEKQKRLEVEEQIKNAQLNEEKLIQSIKDCGPIMNRLNLKSADIKNVIEVKNKQLSEETKREKPDVTALWKQIEAFTNQEKTENQALKKVLAEEALLTERIEMFLNGTEEDKLRIEELKATLSQMKEEYRTKVNANFDGVLTTPSELDSINKLINETKNSVTQADTLNKSLKAKIQKKLKDLSNMKLRVPQPPFSLS